MDRPLQLTKTYILLGVIALVGILAVACPSPDDSTTDDMMLVEPPADVVVTEPDEPEPTPDTDVGDVDDLTMSDNELVPKDQFEPLEFVNNEDCSVMDGRLVTNERFSPPIGVTIDVDGIVMPIIVLAETATSATLRNQGLMCRSRVPEQEGMLFLFDDEDDRRFWMFNTYVPLDIIYISADGSTDRFFTMTPCPRNDGEDSGDWGRRCAMESRGGSDRTTLCEGYQSCGRDIVAALELPAGWLEKTIGMDLTETRGVDEETSVTISPSITVSWDLNRIIVPGETP